MAAAPLREAFQHPVVRTDQADVMLRDLADYDAAFGVDIDLRIELGIDLVDLVDLDVEVVS